MFGESLGAQASWLLPAALIGLLAGLWFTRRTIRSDGVRAALLLWGGWLLVTAAVFSFMDGIIHPYYTVAVAPAIAALVGISARELWRRTQYLVPRVALAATSAATGVWAFILLARTPDWWPALRWVVLIGSIIVAAVVVVGAHRLGRATVAVATAAIFFGVAGTTAYTIATVADTHGGAMVMAGPARAHDDGFRGPGGPRPTAADPALDELIADTDTRWAAATIGSMTASSLELKTGASIMAIGGFTGADNSPTLAQFQGYVADHEVRYFIAGDGHGPPGRESGSAHDITTWVQQNFTSIDIAGTAVYDLTATP